GDTVLVGASGCGRDDTGWLLLYSRSEQTELGDRRHSRIWRVEYNEFVFAGMQWRRCASEYKGAFKIRRQSNICSKFTSLAGVAHGDFALWMWEGRGERRQ